MCTIICNYSQSKWLSNLELVLIVSAIKLDAIANWQFLIWPKEPALDPSLYFDNNYLLTILYQVHTRWLMKSEPESRLEKGVDVKVKCPCYV